MYYFEIEFSFSPYSAKARSLFADLAAKAGFETYEKTEANLVCYVQQERFDMTTLAQLIQNPPIEGTTISCNICPIKDNEISLRMKGCNMESSPSDSEVIFNKSWVSAPENQDADKWNIDIHLHFQINNYNNKKLYVRMTTALYNQPNVVLSIQDKECIPDSDHCEWEDFQSYINEHSQKWPNKDARLKLTTTFQVLDESKQPLTMATSEVTYNVYHKIQRFQKNELYLNMAINNFEETGQIIVPENVLPKVIKIIDGYNKKAKKWGYEILSYNEDTRAISGKFKPKEDARKSKSGFFSEMKEAYKYGDLGEEWERILRLCRLK